MSQTILTHHRTRSAPEANADFNPGARSLLNLISLVRAVASDASFLDIEATLAELISLRKNTQDQAQKIELLEGELKEVKAKNSEANEETQKHHDSHTRKLVKNHRDEVAEVEAAKKSLHQQLLSANNLAKGKEDEAVRLTKTNSDLNKRIEASKSSVEEARLTIAANRKEVEGLLSKVKDKDEVIQKQKENLSHQGSRIESLTSENKTLKKEIKANNADLEKYKSKLNAVQAYAGPLQEDNTSKATENFNELWNSCVSAVRGCFENDIHEGFLQDPKALDNLRTNNIVQHQVPLPPSNSITAKTSRCLVVLALISQLLVDRIFATTDLVHGDYELRRELCELSQTNHSKEAFTRTLLLSLEGPGSGNDHVHAATQEAHRQVQGILDPISAEGFRQNVEAIFNQAAGLWHDLRSQKSRYEAELDVPEDQSVVWKSLRLSRTDLNFKEHEVTSAELANDMVAIKVFPHIFVIGPQGEMQVIPGKVVQTSQLEAMRQESAQLQRAPPIWRRSTASSERNKATSRRRRDTEPRPGAFLESNTG